MQTETITIQVEPELARAFRAASDEERAKLNLLLSLRLHDVLLPAGTLDDVMSQISREAQERGMTPEILESILNDSESQP